MVDRYRHTPADAESEVLAYLAELATEAHKLEIAARARQDSIGVVEAQRAATRAIAEEKQLRADRLAADSIMASNGSTVYVGDTETKVYYSNADWSCRPLRDVPAERRRYFNSPPLDYSRSPRNGC
jgi:hypothetical protein